MNLIDLRLKIRHFFKRFGNTILIILIIWAIIFFINLILKYTPKDLKPETTLQVHTSIIDSEISVPNNLKSPIVDMINEYVGYCNEGELVKAFNMLSDNCRYYSFDDSLDEFAEYVFTVIPAGKKHAIQNYSNVKLGSKRLYIYEIKYTDDLLATGLTDMIYGFTSEKMTFQEVNGKIEMNIGSYIYHSDIKSIAENEYLKIDIVDKVVKYDSEQYKIKLTNRSNYTVVISDGQENGEISLVLPYETREIDSANSVVLKPGESKDIDAKFQKFVDDGDESESINFSSIRVMEKYSGTNADEETRTFEIDNAIAKFSMNVRVTEKE